MVPARPGAAVADAVGVGVGLRHLAIRLHGSEVVAEGVPVVGPRVLGVGVRGSACVDSALYFRELAPVLVATRQQLDDLHPHDGPALRPAHPPLPLCGVHSQPWGPFSMLGCPVQPRLSLRAAPALFRCGQGRNGRISLEVLQFCNSAGVVAMAGVVEVVRVAWL